MAELVRTRTDASINGLDAELPQQSADRIRCRCNGQRRRIQTDKERPWIRSSLAAHQALPLSSVATKLRNQVGANGDDTRTALAALDREGSMSEVDIGRAQPDRFPQPESRFGKFMKDCRAVVA